MKSLPILALLLAVTPAHADESLNSACYDFGYDAGAAYHYDQLIKHERANPGGTVDVDALHFWGSEEQCFEERARNLVDDYKERTGRKLSVPMCNRGEQRASFNEGISHGLAPESTCTE